MSFILDALARSYAARAEHRVRSLSRRSLRQAITIAVLLALLAALAAAYLHTLRSQRTKPAAQAAAAPHAGGSSAVAAATPLEVPSMAPLPARRASAPAAATPAAPRSVTRALPEPRAVPRFTPPTALSQPLPNPSPLGPGGHYVSTPAPAPAVVATPPRSEAPPTVTLADLKPLSALPPQARAAITRMKVRVLFYTPQRRHRFVLVDSREIREGDELFDGLRLEEITDTGLVLKHKDTLVLAPALAAR
jgi:hypothetical protein